jgi:hypothetical protein
VPANIAATFKLNPTVSPQAGGMSATEVLPAANGAGPVLPGVAGPGAGGPGVGGPSGQPEPGGGRRDPSGRYELRSRIGKGSFGEVFVGWDHTLGRQVAIKVIKLRDDVDEELYRREAVALRGAAVPGVVRLLDDVRVADGRREAWLIMELIEGEAFGVGVGRSWASLRPALVSLLQTLARLHFKGFVHQDIKPTNVLVHGGLSVVLDLGIARGNAMGWLGEQEGFEGNGAYSPPEQRRQGKVSPAVDVYAVAAMTYEVLTGLRAFMPEEGESPFFRHGTDTPVVPLHKLRPDLDRVTSALIDAMLLPNPDHRPTAVEALMGLDEAPPLVPAACVEALPEVATAEDLRALFHGPEHFLHLPTDAAQALFDRTGGRRDVVLAELNACLMAGIGSWEDGAVRVDRVEISRLRATAALRPPRPWTGSTSDRQLLTAIHLLHPKATPARVAVAVGLSEDEVAARLGPLGVWLTHDGSLCADPIETDTLTRLSRAALLPAALDALPRPCARRVALMEEVGAPPSDVLAELLAIADAPPDIANAEGVIGLQERALELALAADDPALEVRVFAWVTRSALDDQNAARWERAEAMLGRARPGLGEVDAMLGLIKVFKQRGTPAAYAQWRALGPFSLPDLERSRLSIGVLLARGRGMDALRELLTEAQLVEDRPEALLPRAQAFAHLRYLEGDYRDAARWHLRAAEHGSDEPAALSAQGNAVAALLDGCAFEDVLARGASVGARAASLRNANWEARASYLIRSAEYRSGGAPSVSMERTDAASAVSPMIGSLHALVDCGVLLRNDDFAQCGAIAERGLAWSVAAGARLIGILFSCVLASSGDLSPTTLRSAVDAATDPKVPWGVALQCLALLRKGGVGNDLDKAFEHAWQQATEHNLRRELLSPDECRIMFHDNAVS